MYFWRYNIICEFELLQLVYIYKSVIYFLTFQSIELVELVAVEIEEQPQHSSTRELVCHITFNMIKLVTVLYLYILLTMLFFCGRGVNIAGFKTFAERSEAEDSTIFGQHAVRE